MLHTSVVDEEIWYTDGDRFSFRIRVIKTQERNRSRTPSIRQSYATRFIRVPMHVMLVVRLARPSLDGLEARHAQQTFVAFSVLV